MEGDVCTVDPVPAGLVTLRDRCPDDASSAIYLCTPLHDAGYLRAITISPGVGGDTEFFLWGDRQVIQSFMHDHFPRESLNTQHLKDRNFSYKPAICVADVRTPLQDARASTGEAAGVEDRRDLTVSSQTRNQQTSYLMSTGTGCQSIQVHVIKTRF